MQIILMHDLKNTVEIEWHCAKENGSVYVTKNEYGRNTVTRMPSGAKQMWKLKHKI